MGCAAIDCKPALECLWVQAVMCAAALIKTTTLRASSALDTLTGWAHARLAQMEELAALVNILLVAPDSLIGLVQTSLRMSHKQALQYIRLREDFATAKVDGIPLAKLFSHE